MTSPDRLYAEYFRAAFAQRIEDARCYVTWCGPEPQEILELGCGTGRVTQHLVDAGHAVCAVDRSVEMLAALRRSIENAELCVLEGDARSVRLDREFDSVLLPFNVLGCLDAREHVGDALRTARLHCRREGAVCFDVLVRQPWHVAGGRGVVPWMDLESVPAGARVEEVWRYDVEGQCLVTELLITSLAGGDTARLQTTFLLFDESELRAASAEAGLEVTSTIELGDSVFFRCAPR